MKQRPGYKVQVREVPFWQQRYRIMRTEDNRFVGKFWTLRGVERWLSRGWWEDVNLDG